MSSNAGNDEYILVKKVGIGLGSQFEVRKGKSAGGMETILGTFPSLSGAQIFAESYARENDCEHGLAFDIG